MATHLHGDNTGGLRLQCLCLDIETAKTGSLTLREIGAYRPDKATGHDTLHLKLPQGQLLEQLNAFGRGAAFVLGHNIAAHDKPALSQLYPDLELLAMPLLDTLELSPVAFPQNPYHRLVKD